MRGADTGLKPAQAAHPANPAQREINEIVKTKRKEKPQTCSIPAPGTTLSDSVLVLKTGTFANRRPRFTGFGVLLRNETRLHGYANCPNGDVHGRESESFGPTAAKPMARCERYVRQ